ncbi:hypothetical protein M430DRAFT_22752 [Amorphotheca resinae ATCC 22711]|jgi:hypothetical protein|uniref:Uncharacterized protein n=1 Tax=Amorphotheca resinae ATCC 22711 TaxID=857342 RepID=A0A2T3AQH1_AMORE|nr:hypothetical protein M430DRAFT_22752 [Amorphotheca resinae ATCC 22711]PSS08514.1 hypothetical protein M430DRAFT_22752 [Amorphotheca resinae ATCC 22711]
MSGRSGRGGSGRVSQAIVVKVGMLALLTWVKAGRVGRKVEIGRASDEDEDEDEEVWKSSTYFQPRALVSLATSPANWGNEAADTVAPLSRRLKKGTGSSLW